MSTPINNEDTYMTECLLTYREIADSHLCIDGQREDASLRAVLGKLCGNVQTMLTKCH